MITIERFVFNAFQENTFLLYDETGECIIIDPGCYDQHEQVELVHFIDSKNLKPVKLLYTHCHIDHILGNNFICETYNLKPEIHKAGLPFLLNGHKQGELYGFYLQKITEPENFIEDGDSIRFGHSVLRVAYTPGHADGSVCFINEEQKFVITGDVLFHEGIGRTDFPTGDFNLLMESIRTKLFSLEDDFVAWPGHGPETTIGHEKMNNPFVRL